MSSIYTVPYSGTLTNAGGDSDLFYLKPAADKPIRLRGISLSQSSEIGDAGEEGLQIDIIALPATVTAGSGGSAVTPVDVDSRANTTAGFTARCNDTTIATTNGTAVTKEKISWNERNTPYEKWWPDERYAPNVANAAAIVVRCMTTPADDMTIAIVAYVEELP
jgi:hypothetical protein